MGQILNLQKLLPPAVESSYSESPFMPVNKRELGTQPGCWSKRGTRPPGSRRGPPAPYCRWGLHTNPQQVQPAIRERSPRRTTWWRASL